MKECIEDRERENKRVKQSGQENDHLDVFQESGRWLLIAMSHDPGGNVVWFPYYDCCR